MRRITTSGSRRSTNMREIAVPHGVVWTTDECDAVAVWVPTQPTATSLVVPEPLKAELHKLAGSRACAAATAQELVVARLPRHLVPGRDWRAL